MREVFKNIQDEKIKLSASTLNVIAGLPSRAPKSNQKQKSGGFSLKKFMIALPGFAAVIAAAIIIPILILGRDYKLGNISGSGTIGEADYAMLCDYIDDKITLTEKQLKAADLNGDGIVDNLDKIILRRYLDYGDITLPCNVKSGDITGSGEIAREDAIILIEYLEGTTTLTPVQLLAADVNCDGVIDDLDLIIILAHLAGIE